MSCSRLQPWQLKHSNMTECNRADVAPPQMSASPPAAPPASFFGGAFFGLDLPPGFNRPTDTIPDLWTADLAEQHADSTGLSGLHRASRGCRLWVLRHIPTLRLSISNAEGQPWAKDLQIIAAALAARGPRPTRVAVEQYVPEAERADHGFLEQVAEALAGDALTELRVTCKWHGDEREPALAPDVSDFVARVARTCPRLASLEVTDAVCRLPPPAQLPHLTQFTVGKDERWIPFVGSNSNSVCVTASCSTVPPYLGQLTSLHLKSTYLPLYSKSTVWSSTFPAQAPITHGLTHLTIHDSLNDSAISLLLPKAPSLQRLAVDSIDIQKAHTEQWAVERLECRDTFTAQKLLWLPTRAAGQTELVCQDLRFFESAEVRSCTDAQAMQNTATLSRGR